MQRVTVCSSPSLSRNPFLSSTIPGWSSTQASCPRKKNYIFKFLHIGASVCSSSKGNVAYKFVVISPEVSFVFLAWFVRWKVSGRIPNVL